MPVRPYGLLCSRARFVAAQTRKTQRLKSRSHSTGESCSTQWCQESACWCKQWLVHKGALLLQRNFYKTTPSPSMYIGGHVSLFSHRVDVLLLWSSNTAVLKHLRLMDIAVSRAKPSPKNGSVCWVEVDGSYGFCKSSCPRDKNWWFLCIFLEHHYGEWTHTWTAIGLIVIIIIK